MSEKLESLHNTWAQSKASKKINFSLEKFKKMESTIFSTGPFYYYVIDFFDMSLSNISDKIDEIHGFNPEQVNFNDILNAVHPDDLDFVSKAEKKAFDFIYEKLGVENLLKYKFSYCFRFKLKDGSYALFNHQSLVLTIDEDGKMGRSLNIHTRIDHLTDKNTLTFSIISIDGSTSYMNIEVYDTINSCVKYTKREVELIKFISDGLTNEEIASKMFISPETVKKHRANVLKKSNCKNSNELVKKSILQGVV